MLVTTSKPQSAVVGRTQPARGPRRATPRSYVPATTFGLALALVVGLAAGTASAAPGSSVGGAASPARPAAHLLASSSPGITATTITVGQVDDLTAPLPGLFKGAEDGTRAYFDYVNSQGGVNGRKIQLDARDSAYQGGTVANATSSLISSDFALVGGFSLLDSAEQPLIDSAHVPDVAYPLSVSLANSPNVYSPDPNTANDFPLGFMKYLKKKYPKAVKHVGILWANATSSTAQSERVFENGMRKAGFHITYDRGFGVAESTFLSDVLAMKSKGVQLFYSQQMPDAYAATLAKEMKQQNFKPIVIQGAAYSSNLVKDGGSAVNNMFIQQAYPLYLPGQDAKNVPAAALFDHWMNVADSPPNFEIEAVYGWMSAELFVEALRKAGSDPTRASLTNALNSITSFNAGGMISNANPAENIPSSCFMLAQIKSGHIVRVSPTPKSGFACPSGGFLPAKGFTPEVRPAASS